MTGAATGKLVPGEGYKLELLEEERCESKKEVVKKDTK
jgi:hypothetical protein